MHCYNFDPYVEVWKQEKNSKVEVQRLPAVFTPEFAKAIICCGKFDVVDEVHTPIFNAIHIERKDMADVRTFWQKCLSASYGVPEEDFLSVYDSFAVRSKIGKARAECQLIKITGIPTMVVSGKLSNDGRMAGSNNEMLEVV